MPSFKTLAHRLSLAVVVAGAGFALCACGDRETGNVANIADAPAVEDPVGNMEANAIAANSMQTSAQSNAMTTASPEATADAGNLTQ